jgi:FkbM family methyltransferase
LKEGFIELETAEVLESLVTVLKERENRPLVYLDIGAHTGTHVLHMAPLVDGIIAVEPFPPVLARLQRNISLNNLKHVEVLPVGFGDKIGEIPFLLPPDDHQNIGTFSNDVFENNKYIKGLYPKSERGASRTLPIVTGDSVIKDRIVSLVKLDIEGYERYALKGLKTVMQRSRPPVVFELNVNRDGGFMSKEDLETAFPSEYSFYQVHPIQSHPDRYVIPFDFTFRKGLPRQVVAIPSELRSAWDRLSFPRAAHTQFARIRERLEKGK